jgi:F-type H+-transporting ATPase subunit b
MYCIVLLAEGGILDPRFDLGIWTVVIFVLLLLLLQKTAWGPMLEGLRKREGLIRDSIEEAKRTRAEMERLRTQFQQELAEAHAKIPALMDEARADAQRLAEEMRVKANEEIQAEKQRARRELELARDQALQELWTQAAQLATLISAKAIGRSLSEDDHRRLVDESVREMAKN